MGLGDGQHVQMGMADIRRAHKAGGRAVENMSRRREMIATSVSVPVDFSDMRRLAAGFLWHRQGHRAWPSTTAPACCAQASSG